MEEEEEIVVKIEEEIVVKVEEEKSWNPLIMLDLWMKKKAPIFDEDEYGPYSNPYFYYLDEWRCTLF